MRNWWKYGIVAVVLQKKCSLIYLIPSGYVSLAKA